MSYSNWSEFWAMGGYGYFVWMSYGFTLMVLVVEVLVSRQRHRARLAQLRSALAPSTHSQPAP